MAYVNFTRRLIAMAPRWLRNGESLKFKTAFGSRVDNLVDRLIFGLKAGHPGLVTTDNLRLIGRDRLLRQGIYESVTAYAARLRPWRQAHTRRGNGPAMLQQLFILLQPNCPEFRLYYRNGLLYTMNGTTGVITRGSSSIFGTDGSALQWARYWIVTDGNNAIVTANLEAIKRVVSEWHAEHCIGYGVVINGDRAWDNSGAWDSSLAWDSNGLGVVWQVTSNG